MKARQAWALAFIGTALSILGDLFLGWLTYAAGIDRTAGLLLSCQQLSYARIGIGAFLGALGIPLTFFGFEQFARLVEQGTAKRAALHGKIVRAGAYSTAFWGAAVHVLCAAAMAAEKFALDSGFAPAGDTAMDAVPHELLAPALWLLVPITVVFMLVYTAACIVLFADIAAGKTCLARWACVCNPLVCKMVLNVLSNVMPNTPLFNGLRFSNMGFGTLVLFAGFFAAGGLELYKQNEMRRE